MERGSIINAVGTIKILAMVGENEKIVEVCNGLLDELEAEAALTVVVRAPFCEHGYNGLCPVCDALQTPPKP